MRTLKFNLQLFADGGATGATTGTTGETGTTTDAGLDGRESKPQEVVYGKQTQQVDTAQDGQTQADTKPSFDDLIKGDYKADFDKRVQSVINRRFRETKQLQSQLDSTNLVVQEIAQRYNADPNNINGILAAIQSDDALYEQEANEKGMTVQQLKAARRLEYENKLLRQQKMDSERQAQADRQYNHWIQQSENVKRFYPEFDLANELANINPETGTSPFLTLLQANVDVKTAYEVAHKDDLIAGAMYQTAQTVQQKMANNIQNRAKRPAENGTGGNASVLVKADVNALTKADRDEIIRRVAHGEKISF